VPKIARKYYLSIHYHIRGQFRPGSHLGRSSPSSALRRGGDPSIVLHTGGGDLHIQPSIHSTWSPGQTSLKFTAVNMVEGPVYPFFLLKKPPVLPFAAFHHPPWDYGIVFALWSETPL
jgi:hypothetical protein